MMEKIGLCSMMAVCLVPLLIWIVLMVKGKGQRRKMAACAGVGICIYMATQWGIKEQGLTWLFNHTSFSDWMEAHYIAYLFVVAAAGAMLTVIPAAAFIKWGLKHRSFLAVVSLGLGYTMAESVLLVGYRSLNTWVELGRDSAGQVNLSATDMFLSTFERILMLLIELAVFVAIAFLADRKKTAAGSIGAWIGLTMTAFLPGFFVAFSTAEFYKVYDASFGLLLNYIVLGAAAFTGCVILAAFRKEMP